MANPSYLIQPNIQRLPSLIQDIQTGEIRVPRFQRPFVWKIQQCLDLFKSIYDGIPIGSILLGAGLLSGETVGEPTAAVEIEDGPEARASLGEVGWEDLDDQVILATCKALLDLDIYYAKVQNVRTAISESPQVLDEATTALKLAARFLRDRCKVYGPAVLPYSSQIILLADTLRLASQDEGRSPDFEAVLERWFWRRPPAAGHRS